MKNKCDCLCHILPSNVNKSNSCMCCLVCPYCKKTLMIDEEVIEEWRDTCEKCKGKERHILHRSLIKQHHKIKSYLRYQEIYEKK